MASKAEAMEHMKRGGMACYFEDGCDFMYRMQSAGIVEMKYRNLPADPWEPLPGGPSPSNGYTLLPIEPVDLLTPEERGFHEQMRDEWRSNMNILDYVKLVDRLAPKPVKPIPQWVEEFANSLEYIDENKPLPSYVGIAANLRAAARKAMEDGNG